MSSLLGTAGLGLAPVPHKNTYQGHSFLCIWVKQDLSGSGTLEKLVVWNVGHREKCCSKKLQAPTIWFERAFSKSEGAIEAGAGSQGQILARGCSPQKTAAAATTTSQVQAKKAECIPERGFHEAVAEGGRLWRWGWGNKGKEGTAPEGLGTKKRVTGDSSQRVSVALEKAKQLVSPETEWEGKKKSAYSYQEEEEVGDVLLPVERTMIEDKAG